jgi:hypothetical protein
MRNMVHPAAGAESSRAKVLAGKRMITDLRFAHGYRVELLEEWPGAPIPNWYYIPPQGSGGRDGILLHILPDGENDWMGCFAFGSYDLSAVIASPQDGVFFVVAEGEGYVVNAKEPSAWHRLPCSPVRHARILPEHGLVLFADFTHLVAYGKDGLKWKSRRLCWDDLEIVEIAGTKMIGSGYDCMNSIKPEGRFELDLLTGSLGQTDFAYAYQSCGW